MYIVLVDLCFKTWPLFYEFIKEQTVGNLFEVEVPVIFTSGNVSFLSILCCSKKKKSLLVSDSTKYIADTGSSFPLQFPVYLISMLYYFTYIISNTVFHNFVVTDIHFNLNVLDRESIQNCPCIMHIVSIHVANTSSTCCLHIHGWYGAYSSNGLTIQIVKWKRGTITANWHESQYLASILIHELQPQWYVIWYLPCNRIQS